MKLLNIKDKEIIKASTEKNRSHAKHQNSKVFLNIYTENYEATENALKTDEKLLLN